MMSKFVMIPPSANVRLVSKPGLRRIGVERYLPKAKSKSLSYVGLHPTLLDIAPLGLFVEQ
jgi:hypothetical protein